MNKLSRDVGTVFRSQEYIRRGYLARLTRSSKSCILPEVCHVIKCRRDKRRPDRAWGHAVYADLVRGKHLRQGAGKSDNSSLGTRIIYEMFASPIARHRAGIDDRIAGLEVI